MSYEGSLIYVYTIRRLEMANLFACDRDEQKMPSLADWIEVFRASIPSFQQRAEQDPSFDSSIAKVNQAQTAPPKADLLSASTAAFG